MVGMSVSGYILAAPGRGLRNTVLPSGVAALVSAGTPATAAFRRWVIAVAAYSTLSFGPPTTMKASLSPICSLCLTAATSLSVMP